MPSVSPGQGLVQVRWQMSLAGQQIEFGQAYWGAGESLSYEGLGDAAIAWWGTDVAPNVSSQLTLRQVEVRNITQSVGPVVVRPVPGGFYAGSLSGESLPNNVALVVTLRTNLAGRAHRGRNYIPGIVEADQNLSVVDPTRAAAFLTAWQSLVGADALATGWALAVASRAPAPYTVNAKSYELVTACVMRDTILDSQRRRLPGRGR